MGEQEEKCAEVTKSTKVSPGTNLVFLALSYGVGTRRQFPARGTRGCAGTSGQGAGAGGVLGCVLCRAACAGLHPHSGVSQRLTKDTAPKVCGEPKWLLLRGCRSALQQLGCLRQHQGSPGTSPGADDSTPLPARAVIPVSTEQSFRLSDALHHHRPGAGPSRLPNTREIYLHVPSCSQTSSSC